MANRKSPPHHPHPQGNDELKEELRELKEKAGMLTAVAASGIKKGFGALMAAGKKAAGADKKASGGGVGVGGVPAAFDG